MFIEMHFAKFLPIIHEIAVVFASQILIVIRKCSRKGH